MTQTIDLTAYGYAQSARPEDGLEPGRVTGQHRDRYAVVSARGEGEAVLKGAFIHGARLREDLPCVGDFALLRPGEKGASGPALIERLLPRRTKFSRADLFGHSLGHLKANREQLVAANFDYIFIMSSLNRDFNVNRISRYLTQAWQSGAQPVVILTKADLVRNAQVQLDAVRKAAPGVPAHAVSSRSGLSLEALDEYLRPGKTAVLLGMSGVGKSSLVNALAGYEAMAVKAIREDDARGRHTTTSRRLLMLPSGAMIIDTPGMRGLGILRADEGLSASFGEIEELFAQCRFTDCRHEGEKGCAVLAALESGALSRERWDRYQAQARENAYFNDKKAHARQRAAWAKSLSARIRQDKKRDGFED
ncbi:MAG: ribosome small subunit-dependent GTPase A [Treponema sp.]|nr:ribosome small subunit-dependent GTPase A [Treponema sp.]